ncbi:hypothetical protein L1987_80072 [Smallanthus sonchifolius]|uniref:Uncharacterized protein n=1 Tax=Smallanthus sonchifolius TaxID=185202 RepID=A0ACB8YMA5_9ASTR|nr:hypothetical protein L1987_80072 [Smallanthus sonchifolius]
MSMLWLEGGWFLCNFDPSEGGWLDILFLKKVGAEGKIKPFFRWITNAIKNSICILKVFICSVTVFPIKKLFENLCKVRTQGIIHTRRNSGFIIVTN